MTESDNAYVFRNEPSYYTLNAATKKCINDNVEALNCELYDINDFGLALTAFVKRLFELEYVLPANWRISPKSTARLMNLFYVTVPAPGCCFGELLAQSYQQPRQQSNLNIKKTRSNKVGKIETSPNDKNVGDTESRELNATNSAEMMLSLKSQKYSRFTMMCKTEFKTANDFERFLMRFVFGDCVFSIHVIEFKNYGSDSVYFNAHTRSTKPRTDRSDKKYAFRFLSECIKYSQNFNLDSDEDCCLSSELLYDLKLMYCSDRMLFMNVGETEMFVNNATTFLFCFLTGKYKPLVETTYEKVVYMMCKVISHMEAATRYSLKRNHAQKCGYDLLSTVIQEAGFSVMFKKSRELFYDHLLNDRLSPNDEDHYNISTIMTNTFLNKPPLCGNFY